MTAPATGTAKTLATTDTSGNRPKTNTLGSATPIWAASEVPTGTRSQTGPGRRAAIGPLHRTVPAVAPSDNQNPTDHTNIGSRSTTAITVRHRIRMAACGRPNTNAEADIMAMTPARSTDGSNRVNAMNHSTRPIVASHRHHGRQRRNKGAAAAKTKAMFWPETAVRCDKPDRRKL